MQDKKQATSGADGGLLAKLRREPFRPIRLDELPLLDGAFGASPRKVTLTEESYRTIYENTFMFLPRKDNLDLVLFETGFSLTKKGSVKLTPSFREERSAFRKAMEIASEALTSACRDWEGYTKSRKWDPNDMDYAAEKLMSWLDMEEAWDMRIMMLVNKIEERLSEKDFKIFDDERGIYCFQYLDGFPVRNSVKAEDKRKPHSHVVTFDSVEQMLPSGFDRDSPVIWAVVDVPFIKSVLGDPALSLDRKVNLIMTHHVEGMKPAECVGALDNGCSLVPLVRN